MSQRKKKKSKQKWLNLQKKKKAKAKKEKEKLKKEAPKERNSKVPAIHSLKKEEKYLKRENSLKDIDVYFFCSLDYFGMVDFLLKKYGEVNGDYFIESANGNFYKNKSITRGAEGLEIHHIGEYIVPDLSKEHNATLENLQKAHFLVYANNVEHFILHLLINKEQQDTFLGLGGIVNHGLFEKAKIDLSFEEKEFLEGELKKLPNYNILISEKALKEKALKEKEEKEKEIEKQKKEKIKEYKKGISRISEEELSYFIGKSKHFTQYNNFYLAKAEDDIVLFFSRNKQNELILWSGKTRKKISNIKEEAVLLFYMKKMFYYYKKYDEDLKKVLVPISNFVKKQLDDENAGQIHGAIIDIDYFNHIKFDLQNKDLIAYTAPSKALRKNFKNVFEALGITSKDLKSREDILENKDLLLLSDSITGIFTPSKKFEGKLLENNKNNEKIITVEDSSPNFYTFNAEISLIQKTLEDKVFYLWSEDIWNFIKEEEKNRIKIEKS